MLLKPWVERDLPKAGNFYRCPVYRTSARAGSVTTAGHSSNFILSLRLPTAEPKEKWILRGVALVAEPLRV
jgi:dynein heavy chain